MLFIKTLHLLFIISWLSGLFYLPRIFVNLVIDQDLQVQKRLLIMANKLYSFMHYLAALAIFSGLVLLFKYVDYLAAQTWMHVKLLFVTMVLAYHCTCGKLLKKFNATQNKHSHIWYRYFNEIPVFLLFCILFQVVFKRTLF